MPGFACHIENEAGPLLRRSENFELDIPLEKEGRGKGELDLMYRFLKADGYRLGLDSLELGYDSLQIRIWLGCSMAIKRDLIILKCNNAGWKGSHVAFTEPNGTGEAINKTVRSITPRSGWKAFTDSLRSWKILDLPDQSAIDGYKGCGTDGDPFYFEWATTKQYRFYQYCNLKDNIDDYWQAANALKMADFWKANFSSVTSGNQRFQFFIQEQSSVYFICHCPWKIQRHFFQT